MIRNSGSEVADQILIYNKNVIDILSKIQQLMYSDNPTIQFTQTDINGVTNVFTVPSFGYMQSQFTKLSNSLNSLYSLDGDGTMVQTNGSNVWKKVVTVDLNKEPNDIQQIASVSNFTIRNNWFLDKMINPSMFIDIDLKDQIDNSTNKCSVKRYIINFEKNEDGSYTTNGQNAIASFSSLFRNQTNIDINDFITWHNTTTGIVNPNTPVSEEALYDLEANTLQYDGIYTVLRLEEDTVNKKLWYVLNTLDYRDLSTSSTKQLIINDEVIVNVENANTRYKIIEISTASTEPWIRLERIEGNNPVPVGIGTLKLYSPVLYSKKLKVNIGYDERCVLFLKPVNANTNIVAKNWSLGMGFWTNDLKLASTDSYNGYSLEQYYAENIDDYGAAIKDIVSRRTPSKLAGMPNAPSIDVNNFKVVQINKHLTDTVDSTKLSKLTSQQTTLKSEIAQLTAAIDSKNNQLKNTTFTSEADKTQFTNDLNLLIQKKDSKSILLASVVSDILKLAQTNSTVEPKYRVRGFWDFPAAVATSGTLPQEVIQFEISYRYLSKDGSETPLDTYTLDGDTAVFSNWTSIKTDVRLRKYNAETETYQWVIEDVSDADTPNINQLEIAIQQNELVELKIRSISEVGWPEAPVLSEWSDTIQVVFPDELSSVLSDTDFILQEANKDDIKVSIMSDLSSMGLNDLLNNKVVIGNKTYLINSTNVLSGFKDTNGNEIDLFEKLNEMQDKINSLEAAIKLSKGQLEVLVMRKQDQRVVANGSELSYTIECEDYMDRYNGTSSRIFENKIYLVKDFNIVIRNKSVDSPLGLLSSRTYKSSENSDAYNQAVPQVMWVNDQNELLYSNASGQTLTQLDNQFIWSVNYDTINQSNTVKLSNNIGNNFTTDNNNTITNILSSTEYNVGYFENSILTFNSSNNSLVEPSKWIDKTISISSTNKLLTTIHPVVNDLNLLTEKNSDMVKTVNGGEQNNINIPINIYFKLNALDTSKEGKDNSYIDLTNNTSTVRHTKKLKFLLENESENRTFSFVVKFTINRAKTVTRKVVEISTLDTLRTSTMVAYKINK